MVMKQNLLLICVALLVTLSGCGNSSKKSGVKEEEEKPFSLVGAIYAGIDISSDSYTVFRFIDDVNVETTLRWKEPTGEIIGEIGMSTYKLTYPHIIIHYDTIIDIDNITRPLKYEGDFINGKVFRAKRNFGLSEDEENTIREFRKIDE